VLDVLRPQPAGPHDLDRGRPGEVFTVRTYATRRDYEPRQGLVRKFPGPHQQTSSSQRYDRADPATVIKSGPNAKAEARNRTAKLVARTVRGFANPENQSRRIRMATTRTARPGSSRPPRRRSRKATGPP